MDLKAAKDNGLIICNAAGCNSIEVAEQAIGLLIAISRKLMRMNQYVREGKWRRHTAELHAYRGRVYRIQGRTMPILRPGAASRSLRRVFNVVATHRSCVGLPMKRSAFHMRSTKTSSD